MLISIRTYVEDWQHEMFWIRLKGSIHLVSTDIVILLLNEVYLLLNSPTTKYSLSKLVFILGSYLNPN